MLEKNVNTIDRAARAAGGATLLATAGAMCLTRHRMLGGLAGLAGLVLLGTAAIGWCPIYKSLGISTVN